MDLKSKKFKMKVGMTGFEPATLAPHASTLPGCATSRIAQMYKFFIVLQFEFGLKWFGLYQTK